MPALPRIISILLLLPLSVYSQQARVLTSADAASAGMDAAALARGVQLFRDAVERDELRGAVILVARNAKIVLHEAIGWKHHGYRLPSEQSISKATTPKTGTGERGHYGFGWSVSDQGIYSHGGSDGTMAWVDPAKDLLGLVFTQSPGGKNPAAEFQKLVAAACSVAGGPDKRE